MRCKSLAALAAIIAALTCPAPAPTIIPSHAMTMVIPFAAGGPTDVLGRLVAGRMSEIMAQTVIVENINGAGGHDRLAARRQCHARRLRIRARHRRHSCARPNALSSIRSTTR